MKINLKALKKKTPPCSDTCVERHGTTIAAAAKINTLIITNWKTNAKNASTFLFGW